MMASLGKSASNNLDEQLKQQIAEKKSLFLNQDAQIEKLTQELQI